MKKTYTFSWVAIALIALMTLSSNAIFAKRTKGENTETEIISKRTETSKTFKLEGNQYRSKIGGGALHFKNEEGQWQDFNLNVRSSSKAGMAYENVTNGVQSFFPTTLSGSTGVVVKTGTASYQMGSNFSFSFTNDLSSSSYKNEEVCLNGTSATKLNANKVKYDNGNPLGYIEYEVANNQLKQQFVLRQLPAGAIASTAKYLAMSETISLPAGYNIVANGQVVSGSAPAKGHLAITNASGKTVHIIPLPEVFEQNNTGNILYPGGNMPQSYFVNKKANNSYEIKVGVPMSWLKDASRTFPIVIDPTINIPGNWGGWQSSSFGYLEGNPTIYVYTITGSHRAWMKFNTAAIPDNSVINTVELNAFKNNTVGAATMTVNDVTGSYGPYSGGNATVFSDFSNGQYTTFAVNANGIYPNIALGVQASTDLQSKLGSNEFQIALTQSTTTYKRFTSNLSSIDVVYTLCTAPTVTATPSATSACPGNMVTLAGGGAVSYAWTGGITDNTPFAAAATTTTYTVTGTDALSCTATATAVVTINPNAAAPTIVTATPNQICGSGSSVLTATGTNATDSIRWYDATLGGLFIGGTLSGGTLTVNPTTDSTYYAEVKENTAASQTFSYTGSAQTFTVPAGVTSITIETFGAQGGAGMASNVNYGGYSKGTFSVTPSAILNVYAGGQPTGITGGFNGGGTGESSGLGGGGATDVRTAGNTLNDRIIVAGGGGGAGFWLSTTTVVVGGVGGGLVGGDGYRGTPATPGGMGGTQTSSGNGTCGSMNNPIVAGGFGFGGTSTSCGCDGYGGGGGWYGGAAGGNCRGGGGGSGYLLPSATNTSMSSGVRVGNGQVIITWSAPPANCPSTRVPITINVDTIPNVTANPNQVQACNGDAVTLFGSNSDTYTWTGGITNNVSFTPTASTIYTVTGTDASGCSNTATANITVGGPIVVPAPTPELLHYVFDGTGTSVPNLASMPPAGTNTATLIGGHTQGGIGQSGGALIGTGVSSTTNYLNTNWATNLGTSDWTISFWSSNITPSSTLFYVLGDINSSSFRCFTNGVAGANNWILRGGGLSDVLINGGATAAPHVNTWVYNSTLGNVQAYLDGILVNTVAQGALNINGSGPFKVGAYSGSTGLSGNMDEVRVYNRALSPAEVLLLVNSTPQPKLSNATTNNAASVAGTGAGTQTQVAMASMNYYNTNCDLIASLDNNLTSLGSTQADVTVDAIVPTHNGQPYTARWYQITPTNTGIGADVTLYYTQDDFDDYNAVATPGAWPLLPTSATDATGIANVMVTKNDNAGLGVNPIMIAPTSVTWIAAKNHWEILFTTPSFSQFRVHGANPNNSPLPVVYKNFSVRKEATTDVVEWTTTNERNSKLFNVQRSNDGQYFETLGTVISQSQNGNSGLELNYSFIDRDPQLGHNYYRLEQVDIDNNTSLSKVIDIIWGAEGSTVSIYPNPAKDIINIDLATKNSSQVEIKILDMSGRIVKSTIANTTNGLNHLTISLNDIASGIYGVQVYENNKLTHVQKIRKND